MIAWRRSRKPRARNTRMRATTAATVTNVHCVPTPGCTAHHVAATSVTAVPSRTPISTRLDRRATSATCSPVSVMSRGPSATGEMVSSGSPGLRAYMSLPVIDSKLCCGTLARRRPIEDAT